MSGNGNSSTGGSNKAAADQKMQRKVEEATIFQSFATIIRNKFASQTQTQDSVSRMDKLYKHPDYAAEKAMLTKMNNNGMVAGMVAGVASFVFLRRGPRLLSGHMLRRSGGAAGYRFDRRSPFDTAAGAGRQQQLPSQNHIPVGGDGGAAGGAPKRPGLFFRTIKFGVDVAVSAFFAAYMSAVWTDKKKMLNDAAEIPLVEGRSLIADELCDDFIRQYGLTSQEVWRQHTGRDGGSTNTGSTDDEPSDVLSAIETFVANCQRRNIHERTLRQEEGLRVGGTRDGEHIAIPSPGVPRDIDVVLGELSTAASNDESGEEGDDAGGFGYDDDTSEWSDFDSFSKK